MNPTQEIDKKGMQQLNQTDASFKLHQFIDGFGYLYVTVTAPVSAAKASPPWHGRGRRFDPDQVHQPLP